MAFYEATKHPQIKKYVDKRSGGGRYLVRYRSDQNRLTMKRGFTTMRDAKAFLVDQEAAKAGGRFIAQSSGRVSVGELWDPWIAHKAAVRKRSSVDALRGAWETHVEQRWGDVRVADVRASEVAAWVAELAGKRSASVTIRAHGVLAGLLDAAVKDRLLVANPARGVDLPRKVRKARRRYLSAEEVEAVAVVAGETHEMYRVVVLVLAYTGLRWGELAALRGASINEVRRRLLVEESVTPRGKDWILGPTKGYEARSVPVPRSIFEELMLWARDVGPDELVFPAPRKSSYLRSPNKASISRTTGQKVKPKWWEKALDANDLPYMSPHDLRHTAASLAISAGANVKALQAMLGHSSAAMTLDVYSDLFDDDLDAVGARLDEIRPLRREHKLSTTPPDIDRSEQSGT